MHQERRMRARSTQLIQLRSTNCRRPSHVPAPPSSPPKTARTGSPTKRPTAPPVSDACNPISDFPCPSPPNPPASAIKGSPPRTPPQVSQANPSVSSSTSPFPFSVIFTPKRRLGDTPLPCKQGWNRRETEKWVL
ncbi:hypothetical protein BCIN_03g02610 [Botrytis cinerea B05.10]|uniref:Uncharacterized protein n=1 Tax=Botryotinia fuckeliana (strain B05.10) TaxID=332648 RepID=A0A384JBR6_BOTFB|nr:hypothetical protein BCIN_03g02610 [Botrytis cinerea B05.10]ATZ47993.1 hypothetical protein BCIN_03g02610 [Botrytis cinerea B05.10]